MASYHVFTPPAVPVSELTLNVSVRAFDATAGVVMVSAGVQVKKETAWTAQDITTVQGLITNAVELTAQQRAQLSIDKWPIEYKALVLALIDALNVLRTHPSIGLAAITPAQALAAIRNKAGTL